MLEALSLVLRGSAVGLVLAIALAGAHVPRRVRWALLPLLLCLAAYLVRSAPQLRDAGVEPLLPFAVGALLFPASFWWLVHNAFEDRADMPRPAVAAAAALVAAGLWSGSAPPLLGDDAAHLLQKAIAVAFFAAALWRLWRGSEGDLVSGRRVLRGWLLAYIAAHGLVVLGAELALRGQAPVAWLDALNVAAITAALAIAAAFLLRLEPAAMQTLFGPPATPPPIPVVQREPMAAAPDTRAIEQLQRLMTVDCLYRDPELSVATLARRLGLPEYRLRELIHRRLGHRNFPAFVNDHRLQEVERKLADPAFDRRPILTLALEAGFGSIGPFNRAFRERHGVTPTEFRQRRVSAAEAG